MYKDKNLISVRTPTFRPTEEEKKAFLLIETTENIWNCV